MERLVNPMDPCKPSPMWGVGVHSNLAPTSEKTPPLDDCEKFELPNSVLSPKVENASPSDTSGVRRNLVFFSTVATSTGFAGSVATDSALGVGADLACGLGAGDPLTSPAATAGRRS